jgi:TolB-like protein/Tfp pilus assembly protein PilF
MSDELRFGRIEVRPALRQVWVDGKPVVLGSRAFDLLMVLVERRDRLVPKDELLDAAWPNLVVEENNLSVQISALRRALGPDAITTVTGRGYRFTPAPAQPENEFTLSSPASERLLRLAQRPRIAVLPFDCEDASSYFGDGFTEEIISALAANRSLFVIARSSTLRYRGSTLAPNDIAQELNVQYLLGGTVRRHDGNLRLLAELVDPRADRIIWSERFQGADNDVFDFQSQIASNIAGAIDPSVTEAELERLDRLPTNSLSAYDCVLRGLALQVTFDEADFAAAGEYFQRAIELDPHYAQAHAHLAWWHNLRVGEGRSSSMEADRQASEELSLRGIALDSRDALVWAIAAHVQGFIKHRLAVAMDMFEQALTINPCCAFAWARSATTANYLGRGEDAQQRVRNAIRLSPFDMQAFTFLTTNATASFVLGRYDEAILLYEKARRANPRYKASWRMLIASLALVGRIDEARTEAAAFMRYDPAFRVSDFSTWYPMQEPQLSAVLRGMRLAGLPE